MATLKHVDVTPLFIKSGIPTGRSIMIEETDGMYPYKEKIDDNWAYFTAVGCRELKKILGREERKVTDIGIVGICSGVEGIAVAYVFSDMLKRLLVTDIDDGILKGTIKNIRATTSQFSFDLIPLVGSFCEPIEKAGYAVDLVHANIPNLPATGEEDLSKGAEKGTFVPSSVYEGYHPPDKFVGWALGAQYGYLESAIRVLKNGGAVITELGGRVPWDVVELLFDAHDLLLSDVVVGFKEQTEALIDFLGYHRMEQEYGVQFEFYLCKESINILQKNGFANPTAYISSREIKQLLSPYQISAGEAFSYYEKGVPVGHTVHLLRGVLKTI